MPAWFRLVTRKDLGSDDTIVMNGVGLSGYK
jgi:hypothetical protein